MAQTLFGGTDIILGLTDFCFFTCFESKTVYLGIFWL